MALYDSLFGMMDLQAAQVLVTRNDFTGEPCISCQLRSCLGQSYSSLLLRPHTPTNYTQVHSHHHHEYCLCYTILILLTICHAQQTVLLLLMSHADPSLQDHLMITVEDLLDVNVVPGLKEH